MLPGNWRSLGSQTTPLQSEVKENQRKEAATMVRLRDLITLIHLQIVASMMAKDVVIMKFAVVAGRKTVSVPRLK